MIGLVAIYSAYGQRKIIQSLTRQTFENPAEVAMDTPVSFGLWLRQRRKQLDLTQEALAERVGCSVSAIRKIEGDERRPSREVAELLADCLQIEAKERSTFIKVARSELRIERLA